MTSMGYSRRPNVLLAFLVLHFCASLTLAWQITGGVAVLFTNDVQGQPAGTVTFSRINETTTNVTGVITGITDGKPRGLHVHQFGNLTQGCLSAGLHFNPANVAHGDRDSAVRHVGDLGNITPDGQGVATFSFPVNLTLNGRNSVIGRAITLHALTDDLGLGNETDSKSVGHSGNRTACAVIGVASEDDNIPG